MTPSSPDFGHRLALALNAASIGRGRLAAEIGVDKSLISRWLSGQVRPSAHNLERLTRLIASQCAGFSMLAWEADDGGFNAMLGIGAAIEPPHSAAPAAPMDWLPAAALQSRNETLRDGGRYPGLYVQIRHRFANNGLNYAEIVPIWREGDYLQVRFDGPFWGHSGRIYIIGHQLFMIAEDSQLSEGLWFQIMNGVAEGKAMSMDGVLTTVPHDRSHAPGSTLALMLRVADIDPDQEPDPAMLKDLQNRIWSLCEADRVAELSGPSIMAHIDNRIGTLRSDGVVDRHLRAPANRGMTCTDRGTHPDITAAIARWRDALGL